jgi:hypothetical protein
LKYFYQSIKNDESYELITIFTTSEDEQPHKFKKSKEILRNMALLQDNFEQPWLTESF